MKDPYKVIKNPVITEKGTAQSEGLSKYFFNVDENANKFDIKNAVETLFKVKVIKVNKMRVPGKKKRVRQKQGMTSEWIKAVVTLKEGDKIEFV
ncbi:MAG: 50S ribosomal protein L23 [Candidatus Aureabacteria bacterium]|nr:50S ribosomal protein L23 [Candidatus Auribacterota bacterium]MCK5161844.1 50S ribosomal protein L23 [Candidatus Auribacterota bacterium]